MFVCPTVSELRFYGCCHPCFISVARSDEAKCGAKSTAAGAQIGASITAHSLHISTVSHAKSSAQHFRDSHWRYPCKYEETKYLAAGRKWTLGCLLY